MSKKPLQNNDKCHISRIQLFLWYFQHFLWFLKQTFIQTLRLMAEFLWYFHKFLQYLRHFFNISGNFDNFHEFTKRFHHISFKMLDNFQSFFKILWKYTQFFVQFTCKSKKNAEIVFSKVSFCSKKKKKDHWMKQEHA